MTANAPRAVSPRDGSPRLGAAMAAMFVTAMAYGLVLPTLPALIGPRAMAELAAATGTLMASYTLAMVVMSPLWGWGLDRWSARTVLVAGLTGQGLAQLALLFPIDLPTLYAIRIVQGAFGAAVVPAVLTLSARRTSPEEHGMAVARASRAALVGGLAGPLLGGLLARGADLRLPLLVATALTALAIAAVWRSAPDTVPSAAGPADARADRTTLLRLAFAAVVAGLAMGAMEVGISVRGREVLALDPRAIGLMFSGCGAVMIAVQALVFRPQREAHALWQLLAPSFAVSAIGLGLLPWAQDAWTLSLIVALVAGGGGVLLPAISLWIVRSAGRAHGLQLGVRASLGGLGQAAGAIAAGFAFRADAPWVSLVAVLLGLTLAAAWVIRRAPGAPATGRATPAPMRGSPP